MKKVLLKLIRLYQYTPLHTHTLCRHSPTCSQYTYEAIEIHGCTKGIFLGLKRILRCTPWGTCGDDPVPKRKD